MPYLPATLLAGALDHPLRYTLTGCGQSGYHAAYLLEHLANDDGMGEELRGLCSRMSEALTDGARPGQKLDPLMPNARITT